MKVFISWSGDESRYVAQSLREWLPQIIQAVKPWMSDEDISKGTRWSSELAEQLKETKFGIFCLTKDNLNTPWILFEAGAVSKSIEGAFVCTYLIGITPTDVSGPLSQFQATIANKEDTRKLVMTINHALKENPLKEAQISKAFEKWWPDIEEKLKSISAKAVSGAAKKGREDRELLEEILSIVRELSKERVYWTTSQGQTSLLGKALRNLDPAIRETAMRPMDFGAALKDEKK
jgi:hypothetical protein